MALPVAFVKAAKGIKSAADKIGTAKNIKDALSNKDEEGKNSLNSTSIFAFGIFAIIVGFLFFSIVLIVSLSQIGDHALQIVMPWGRNGGGGSSGTVDLNYDYEALLSASESSPIASVSPATDLANTTYRNVDGFNKHIKECVEAAGYGTRAGVVAAGKCLISDYIDATGHRLRYSMGARLDPHTEGITDDTYMDCSSFAWWALYNGGFKIPEESCCFTTPQVAWGVKEGIATKNYSGGKPGDFLIYDHGGGSFGHARLILGTYDGGYYIAEFSEGGQISKQPIEAIEGSYYLFNMDKYYSDSSNVR